MNVYCKFESDLRVAFHDLILQDKEIGHELWSALTNTKWCHKDLNDSISYTFRAAGVLVSILVGGKGDYMDWYYRSPINKVSKRVEEIMSKLGWVWISS